jgi:hypothetical protein|tara:strand:+ start:18290 stop:18799 length:510 start_codon:yes stop_codon:yes gene_type:complete
MDITDDNRIAIGASVLKGLSTNGFLPAIQGQMKVSWNLSIRGRMAAYSAKEGAVQMYGWGLSLRPGKEDTPSKWVVHFDSGRLNAHGELKVSALQVSATRSIVWKKFPLYFGMGMNILNAEPKSKGKEEFQTNFFYVGTTTSFMGLIVKPQIRFGSQFSMFSINIGSTF